MSKLQVQCVSEWQGNKYCVFHTHTHTHTHTQYAHTERRNSLVLHIGLDDGCTKKGERVRVRTRTNVI
jgi:hypothetical protein